MKNFVVWSGLLLASFFSANPAFAGSFDISTGTTTSAQSLTKTGQTGAVEKGATLNVGGGNAAVSFSVSNNNGSVSLTNSGTIEQTGTGSNASNALVDTNGNTTLTITNNFGGTIQSSGADTINLNQSSNIVTLNNSGLIQDLSTSGSQAIDWSGLTKGNGNTLNNLGTGTITSADGDAVRPGVNGVVNNDGTIQGNTAGDSGNDGIAFLNSTNITVTNAVANLSTNSNLIQGAHHGISGGQDSSGNIVNITFTIKNNSNGKIIGKDGSGINIDGTANSSGVTTETGTITNAGLIQGNGVTGDGDGVDVDGVITLKNLSTGTITSTNAVGTGGSLEKSEGVTIGGGSIDNYGTIEGDVLAGNTTAVGRGITLAGVDKNASGGAIPTQGIYVNSSITNETGGHIIGGNDAAIAIEGTAAQGAAVNSVTITNDASAFIEGNLNSATEGGGTSVAAIEAGATATNATATMNNLTILNMGTIDGNSSGKAIDFGNGTNSLTIQGGSAVINGNITGGTGTNTIFVDPGAGHSFSYSGSLSNITGFIAESGTVTLTGASTYTGTTTISGGTTYVNNASGSGTGVGKIAVSRGAFFGGSGIIKPGSGNGITLANGGTLISGGAQSGTSAGHGLTLDNSTAKGTILDAHLGNANLTFFLGAGNISNSGDDFNNPNKNSSYMTVTGNTAGEISFYGGSNKALDDTITINDLTNGSLQLNLNTPYLLISAGSDSDYSGLLTSGMTSLSDPEANGWVENLTLGGTATSYPDLRLYLDDGQLEVVPEPSTWAMLFTGLSIVILVQARRKSRKS